MLLVLLHIWHWHHPRRRALQLPLSPIVCPWCPRKRDWATPVHVQQLPLAQVGQQIALALTRQRWRQHILHGCALLHLPPAAPRLDHNGGAPGGGPRCVVHAPLVTIALQVSKFLMKSLQCSSAGGGWVRFASFAPTREFPQQFERG